jgi:hypothetical protein
MLGIKLSGKEAVIRLGGLLVERLHL